MATRHDFKEPLNLQRFCLDGDKSYCEVWAEVAGIFYRWLVLGSVTLTHDNHVWTLKAWLGQGIRTNDHRTPVLLQLGLIGLNFISANGNHVHMEGWMSQDWHDFLAPPAGYDPGEISLEWCPYCKGDEAHKVVSDPIPKYNHELFESIRGCRLSVRFGPKVSEGASCQQ